MEEEKKVCPLLALSERFDPYCLEERCKWWDLDEETCVLQAIVIELWRARKKI